MIGCVVVCGGVVLGCGVFYDCIVCCVVFGGGCCVVCLVW